jgi:hypothetical protein
MDIPLEPDSCQTQRHKTDRLTPDSHQTQTPPDLTTGATAASFSFLATRIATVRNSFQIFPYRTNGALVQSSVTDIGRKIRSRFPKIVVHCAVIRLTVHSHNTTGRQVENDLVCNQSRKFLIAILLGLVPIRAICFVYEMGYT